MGEGGGLALPKGPRRLQPALTQRFSPQTHAKWKDIPTPASNERCYEWVVKQSSRRLPFTVSFEVFYVIATGHSCLRAEKSDPAGLSIIGIGCV
ncbi:hypothetical protein AVEN_110360-1 [Araneus ventricosus]|uniref:Uncharacterized protein n=1 Tax=Araneus ventricosus TaxID=182803 RepID=A0A4Y2ENE5_ARAVE|nr:hypothetical protein AVEN_110360-1 [Araneus ventricosus]